MKKDFKTEQLREQAAAVRGAVKAKTITPEMVGAPLCALIEAQAEFIDVFASLERERVTINLDAFDGTERVSVEGAKVYVDIFNNSSFPVVSIPRQEIIVPSGVNAITFEVYKGFQYSVFSTLEGLSASFQFTYMACQDSRTIELWHYPIGVYAYGLAAIYNEVEDTYRVIPLLTEDFISDWEERMSFAQGELKDNETIDDGWYSGILIATKDTAFVIPEYSLCNDEFVWSLSDKEKLVPTLPAIYDDDDYNNAQSLARLDFDGNLNTAKILSYCRKPDAAIAASEIEAWDCQTFLPSCGQLYLIYLNRTAINALITGFNNDGYDYALLDKEYCWSSSQASEQCAWRVSLFYGYTGSDFKNSSYGVRGVSAFHLVY